MRADEHGGTAHVPISKLLNASRGSALHTALGEKYDSASDIYEEFLEFVFVDERFAQWESGDKNFELRCSGTPGCGKVHMERSPASILMPRSRRGEHVSVAD